MTGANQGAGQVVKNLIVNADAWDGRMGINRGIVEGSITEFTQRFVLPTAPHLPEAWSRASRSALASAALKLERRRR